MKTITEKSVKFLLKDSRATTPTLIYLVFRYDNKRFITSTGQTITPYFWDAKEQEAVINPKLVRNKIDRETNGTINAHLSRQRSALLKVLNALQLAGIPFDNDTIKQHLDNALERTKKALVVIPKRETFVEYIDRFSDEAKAGKRLTEKSRKYSPNTLSAFDRLKSALERYKADTRSGIDYEVFTLDYYNAFKLWLTGKGLSLNYIGALLKDLKVMLKQAHIEGLHTNTAYQLRDFKKLAEDVDNVYLSDQELQDLFSLDLTDTPRLDRVRDLFLIGCYTGLRFSDYSELRPENITHNGRILTRKTLKTSERVSIPLNPNVLAILAKYEGIPPRTISNQKMNGYLKELCRKAKITESVEVSRTKGGAKQTRYVEKCELITTHTARRSFATNAYLAKVPPVAIMKITGHRSEAVFLRYIKVTSEQNALMLLEHPHFAGIATPAKEKDEPVLQVA